MLYYYIIITFYAYEWGRCLSNVFAELVAHMEAPPDWRKEISVEEMKLSIWAEKSIFFEKGSCFARCDVVSRRLRNSWVCVLEVSISPSRTEFDQRKLLQGVFMVWVPKFCEGLIIVGVSNDLWVMCWECL